MSTQELKKEIIRVIEEVPAPVLNDIWEYLKQLQITAKNQDKYLPLDYSKYRFEEKDLKFNRDEINER